jgi:hypothetical protein
MPLHSRGKESFPTVIFGSCSVSSYCWGVELPMFSSSLQLSLLGMLANCYSHFLFTLICQFEFQSLTFLPSVKLSRTIYRTQVSVLLYAITMRWKSSCLFCLIYIRKEINVWGYVLGRGRVPSWDTSRQYQYYFKRTFWIGCQMTNYVIQHSHKS